VSYLVRDNIIYVTGTVDGHHYRLSTGKKANKLNLSWIEKNHREMLLKLVDKKLNKNKVRSTKFEPYALNSLEVNSATRKENTNKDFKGVFKRHILPFFQHHQLLEIRPSDIKRWQKTLVDKGLMLESIKNCRTVLKGILNDALLDEIITTNPMALVKVPKLEQIEEEFYPFTIQEVFYLIDKAPIFFKNYLIVAFFTGMRTGEILAMKWEDINFERKTILVKRSITKGIIGTTKTGKKREIDSLDIVSNCLLEMKTTATSEWVFHTRKGTPYQEPGHISKKMYRPL